ncbi:MAG: metal-dependent hydrolase [Halobacteriales archaeon]|nr:metal-dependent hydrolase [Halobacteriales archaeon]
MLFATHLVIAWLLARARGLSVVAAVVGAMLPDLVDKPLASAGVVELFHTVGHTALLAPLFGLLALRSDRWLAFAVGWASHLAADALHIVVNGRPSDALFLGWPLVEPPTPLAIPPGEFFWYYLWSRSFFIEVGIWLVALWVVSRELRARASDHR